MQLNLIQPIKKTERARQLSIYHDWYLFSIKKKKIQWRTDSGWEHTVQHSDDMLQNCTPGTYIVINTSSISARTPKNMPHLAPLAGHTEGCGERRLPLLVQPFVPSEFCAIYIDCLLNINLKILYLVYICFFFSFFAP